MGRKVPTKRTKEEETTSSHKKLKFGAERGPQARKEEKKDVRGRRFFFLFGRERIKRRPHGGGRPDKPLACCRLRQKEGETRARRATHRGILTIGKEEEKREEGRHRRRTEVANVQKFKGSSWKKSDCPFLPQ